MSDSDSVTETGELPKFTGPVAATFEAPGGLVVQVPLTDDREAIKKAINKREWADMCQIYHVNNCR